MPHRPHETSGPVTVGRYGYRIKATGHGSERYGPCEVCGDRCDSTYLQVEERCYRIDSDGPHWTYHQCHSLFGHRDCLISRRRTTTSDDPLVREMAAHR